MKNATLIQSSIVLYMYKFNFLVSTSNIVKSGNSAMFHFCSTLEILLYEEFVSLNLFSCHIHLFFSANQMYTFHYEGSLFHLMSGMTKSTVVYYPCQNESREKRKKKP